MSPATEPGHRRCPVCGQVAVAADRFLDGDYCFPSHGGCGRHFNLTIVADGLTKGLALDPYKDRNARYSFFGALVHDLKYRAALSDTEKLALVDQAVAEIKRRRAVENLVGGARNLLVVPAPSSRNRTVQHVYEIAKRLAGERYQYLAALVKITSAESKNMPRGGRYQRGDFRCDYRLDGRSILIVDDTYGEGATLDACISVLRESGAGDVYFLSLCKNMRGGIKRSNEVPPNVSEDEIPFDLS